MFENKNCTKSILRWQFQMFYQKAAVMEALVLKSGFFRFYAPLCIHPSGSVLLLVKHLELPASIICKVFNF